MNKEIGKVSNKIIKILGLKYQREEPIFIGEANIRHMKEEHPEDFEKYGGDIQDIISNPTYLARNQKKKIYRVYKRI